MTASILTLDEIGKGAVAVAGGKGANLGEMVSAGFPVPPGFVVPAHACRDFFSRIGLEKTFSGLTGEADADLPECCRRIRAAIDRTEIPETLAADILAAYDTLVENRGADILCAVRSSATAEDLGDASFAGQHATYYYVDRGNLLKLVKDCWSSLWSGEAVSYRTTQGIDHGSVFMAVVVQEMIRSRISGVTFTANPLTGDREEIVTESSWGMGAAIVDGRVTPDHYVNARNGFALKERRVADKRFMVPPRLEEGSTIRLQEVPHDLRHRETLSGDRAREVAEWAVRAETHFGAPQDVEWAFDDTGFYLLQSRPITVMGAEPIGRGVRGKFVVFKPLVENFTDPLTPLTWDLIRRPGPPGVALIGGRAYLHLKPMRAMLPFKVTEAELAAFVYEMGGKSPDFKLSWLKLPLFLGVMGLLYLYFGVFMARTRRLPDDFMDGYRDLCRSVERDSKMGPLDAVWRLWPWYWTRFFDPAGLMVILVNISAPRYMLFFGLLQRCLRSWLPDLPENAESLLCSGTRGVRSAEMGRGIWELAKTAKSCRAAGDILAHQKPDKVLAALRDTPEAAPFLSQLERFLAVNGHRALKELELRSVRWEENPAPVLGMVRNYLLAEADPDAHEKKIARERDRLEATIRGRLAAHPADRFLGLRWRLVRYLARRTKHFAKMRENSRFYHVMGLYTVRKKIRVMEAQLMERGKLRCKDDIFYLKYDELLQLQADELGWLDVEDRIRDRRMAHIRLSKMTPPKTIGFALPQAAETTSGSPEDPGALKGRPASPGSYQGTAHIILDPSVDIELKPGEILVAPFTDPAWTPLFLTAGAAVVEVGSYLSHAGTVAREFGLPCVVDLPDCTRRIQTGAAIRVDGDRGTVHLIPETEEEAAP